MKNQNRPTNSLKSLCQKAADSLQSSHLHQEEKSTATAVQTDDQRRQHLQLILKIKAQLQRLG